MPNFGLRGDARTLVEMAVEIEVNGWDALFLWDHLRGPGVEPCVDPWVALAAIAIRTERIVLGTMVTPNSAPRYSEARTRNGIHRPAKQRSSYSWSRSRLAHHPRVVGLRPRERLKDARGNAGRGTRGPRRTMEW